MADNHHDENESGPNDSKLDTEHARREVLKRIGIYSVLTAPVLLGALKAEKAVAQTGAPIPGGPGVFFFG